MADPVLERDLQEMQDLEAAVERGVVDAERTLTQMILKVAGQLTKWQWVMHGETVPFRKAVTTWLCSQGKWKKAKRFAMCGRGDTGYTEFGGPGVKIVPLGCGCRFCPRCSRRFGRRFLSRVAKHLETRAHGSMWHVVLTQRVGRTETLAEARERFGKSWKRFYTKLRRCGMASALCTYHVTASLDGGWHYHCHLVIEWKEDVDLPSIGRQVSDDWHWAMRDSGDSKMDVFAREVCPAGPAFVKGETVGQGEFWAESPDPVMAALQYVVRDVLQGVEKWVERIKSPDDAGSFAEALGCAKLHRLYGEWRRQLKTVETAAAADGTVSVGGTDKKAGSKGDAQAWTLIGTMDACLWRARTGETTAGECVQRLLVMYSNRGMVSKRLRQLVKFFAK